MQAIQSRYHINLVHLCIKFCGNTADIGLKCSVLKEFKGKDLFILWY